MRIHELELTNFKGVRSLHLPLGGANARVYGDNATGKTTLMDAFIWLLTGKDHLGRSDLNFNIKTLDGTGAAIPMIEHGVRAVVEHEGTSFELVRIFKEVWAKKTGTNVQTFTGHKTEFYVDSVPRSEKEYTAFIGKIAPPQLLSLLVMPSYFNEQIKADERRKLLLEMCGDVDEAEMLALPEFAELAPHITRMVSVSDLKKAKSAQKSKINDDIKSIPVAINVHMQYLDAGGLNAGVEQAAIDALKARIRALETSLNGLRNGETVSRLRKELAELEAEQINFNILQDQGKERAVGAVRLELAAAQDELLRLTTERRAADRDIEGAEGAAGDRRYKKQKLLERYRVLEAKTFDGASVCPTCGQAIPEETLAAAIAGFNEGKARELETVIADGKRLADEITVLEAEGEKARDRVAALTQQWTAAKEAVDALDMRIVQIRTAPAPAFDAAAIDAKRAEITALAQTTETQETDLASQIKRLSDEKAEHERNLSRLQNAENARTEIDKLKIREKELAAAFEDCERIIALCDEFTNARVKMLDEKISGFFRVARFKLTETLVNGGMREICDTLVDGVPYGAANNAARINVGLDIIGTFSRHYGVSLPVFVDNAESVTALDSIDAQTIQLIVSEGHKTLTMEVV